MKRKSMVAILMAMTTMALSLSGCGERTDLGGDQVVEREDGTRRGCVEGCTCTGGCICCGTVPAEESTVTGTIVAESVQENTQETQTVYSETPETQTISTDTAGSESGQSEPEQNESQEEQQATEYKSEIAQLTKGELRARREQQENFDEARQLLYNMTNSKDKTSKINQMDRQILANNACDFSQKNIVFIGDSITEGITSAVDINGNRISYVTYADSYLHFKKTLNHGMGGRMFSVYGGEELSLTMNFDAIINVDSDIIVVFAGMNDYLSTPENKRFGDVNNEMSSAGYCGSVRQFMKQLREYLGDRDIFFVTMYGNTKKAQCTYSDVEGQPTLDDYMEVQRKLAEEYGFNVIELYDTGFMDCSDKESSDFYLRDGLHPMDNGNIVLGEHIAAELSLYFGRKEVDKGL